MKCPKCGYVSFDYNDNCPKCKKDISTERERMGLAGFRAKSPEMLRSLLSGAGASSSDLARAGESSGKDLPREGLGSSSGGQAQKIKDVEGGFAAGAGQEMEEELSFDLEDISEESIEFSPGEDMVSGQKGASYGAESNRRKGSSLEEEPEEIELDLGGWDEKA